MHDETLGLIRVMIADDHLATLCGTALTLDLPYAATLLQRAGKEMMAQVPARSAGRRPAVSKARAGSTLPSRGDTVAAVAGAMAADSTTTVSPANAASTTAPFLSTTDFAAGFAAGDAARDMVRCLPNADGSSRVSLFATDGIKPADTMAGSRRYTFDEQEQDGAAWHGSASRRRGREPAVAVRGSQDDADDADDVPAVMRGSGSFVVTGAFSRSEEMFDALGAAPCDVLVCDLAMGDGPYGDGLTMLGHLRRQHPGLKVIVQTMCLHACMLRNVQQLPIQGIVSKNDSPLLIPRAVKTVHQGGTYYSPSVSRILAHAGFRDSGDTRRALWSKREAEVIRQFVNGNPVKDIAKALNRSIKTVSTQKMSAMHKAGIGSNAELYQYAAANGLLSMPTWQPAHGVAMDADINVLGLMSAAADAASAADAPDVCSVSAASAASGVQPTSIRPVTR